ncbi:MAG: hypothetical protein AAGF56_09770 [Pseudomonadota bacterium]
MAGIGHNSGKVDEPGFAWRRHVWTKARKDLLPRLPIEVVRLRVRRAKALGLPYKTYAGIRASTGHDLIGFLFSSNALRVLGNGQAIPQDRAVKLAQVDAHRIGLAQHPVLPATLNTQGLIDSVHAAPVFSGTWTDMRDHMAAIIRTEGRPADRFVLVGDTAFEREWAEAARTAGYLAADRYFPDLGAS